MKTVWKTVPSLSHFEASNAGMIRRKTHTAKMPNGGTRTYGGKSWRGAWDATQRRYQMHDKTTGKTYKVARMVCEAFHGAPPDSKPYTLHLDEDSRNNHPNNLKWGTQKENLNHPKFLTYCRQRTGKKNPRFKGRQIRCASTSQVLDSLP